MSQPVLIRQQRPLIAGSLQRPQVPAVLTAPLPKVLDRLDANMEELSLVTMMQERYGVHLGLE